MPSCTTRRQAHCNANAPIVADVAPKRDLCNVILRCRPGNSECRTRPEPSALCPSGNNVSVEVDVLEGLMEATEERAEVQARILLIEEPQEADRVRKGQAILLTEQESVHIDMTQAAVPAIAVLSPLENEDARSICNDR